MSDENEDPWCNNDLPVEPEVIEVHAEYIPDRWGAYEEE